MVNHLINVTLKEFLLYFLQLTFTKVIVESKFISMCYEAYYFLHASWPFRKQLNFILEPIHIGKARIHLRYAGCCLVLKTLQLL